MDGERGLCILGPTSGEKLCGITDQMRCAICRCIESIFDRCHFGRDQRIADATENLKVDVIVPCIDHGDDGLLFGFAHGRRGIGAERGNADGRLVSGKGDATRSRKSHPQSGKTARTGGHSNPIELRKRQS